MLSKFVSNWKPYVPWMLRMSVALPFIYFGITGIPQAYTADWVRAMPFYSDAFFTAFGVLHLVVAAALVVGFKTRVANIVAQFMLLGIIINLATIGAWDLVFRDLAIAGANKASFFLGPGKPSFDEGWKN